MGKPQSKEEIIIAQNAAGSNASSLEEIKTHLSTTNVILTAMIIMFLFAGCLFMAKLYKSCHTKWIRRELNSGHLRRSVYRRRGNPDHKEDGLEQV
ncbi:hypothetical protein JYU34_002433 [Plutella xylostella]|uniref:Uncharacterized protein n=1 Tax=Plutella xylostella TaxID=51655 RepID=A0ABQ7R273_PLUXY|nr:hypothetical protein JYU34_002433 [Plutella xylostella]